MFFKFGVPAMFMDPGDTSGGDPGDGGGGGDGDSVDADDFWRSGGMGDDEGPDPDSGDDAPPARGKGRSIKDDIEDEDRPAPKPKAKAPPPQDDDEDLVEDEETEEPAPKKDAKGSPEKLKVDFGDGKSAREVTADDVKHLVSTYREVKKVADEYARVKPVLAEVQELQGLVDAKDIDGVLEFLGLDADVLHPVAERIVYDKFIESRMTPEEKATAAKDKAAAEERRRDAEDAKRWRETREREESEARRTQVQSRVEKDVHSAIKGAGHAVSPELVDEVLSIMIASRSAEKNGSGKRLSAEEAVKFAHDRLYGRAVPTLKNLEGEQLLKALGPDLLRKVRAAEVAQARGVKPRFTQPNTTKTDASPAAKSRSRLQTIDEALGFRR